MDQLNPLQAIQNPSSERSPKCEPNWLAEKMAVLFSAYRLDNYPDPKGFMAQAGMVLERYDPQVVAMVTSPLTGIQRKCKFPPTIAELVEECDRVAVELVDTERRRNAPKMARDPVVHRVIEPGQGFDEMVKKHGKPIGRFE